MENRIGELRKEKGMTLKQLAEKFELRDNTLSQYETGKRKPSVELLFLLADYFDVTIDYLLKLTDERVGKIKDIDEAFSVLKKIKYGDLKLGDISTNNKIEIAKLLIEYKDKLEFINKNSKFDEDFENTINEVVNEIENFVNYTYDEDIFRLELKNEFNTNREVIREINEMLYKHTDYYGATPEQILEFMIESERIDKSEINRIISIMKDLPDNNVLYKKNDGD